MKKEKKIKAWGGFIDDKLDSGWHVENNYKDGHYGIFKTHIEAKRHYQDVRKLEIILTPQ